MRDIFFSKNYANAQTHSFTDIYAIRILDERNDHSLPALITGTRTLQIVIPLATSTECLTKKKPKISIYPQKLCYASYKTSAINLLFLNIKLDRQKKISIFVVHS